MHIDAICKIRVANVTRVVQHAASNTVSYIAKLELKQLMIAGNDKQGRY